MTFGKIIPFILFLLITGCGVETDSCGDLSPDSNVFDIVDADIQVLVVSESRTYPEMVLGDTYIANTDVEYNDIVFSISSEIQLIAAKREKTKDISFSLISSAYACSQVPPRTNEKIVDIKITSSSAFDNTLDAGYSLKSKFSVAYADSETPFYGYDNDLVVYHSLIQYLEQDDVYAGKIIQLTLTEAPEFGGSHFFFIELMLNTGEIFTLETPEINFTQL